VTERERVVKTISGGDKREEVCKNEENRRLKEVVKTLEIQEAKASDKWRDLSQKLFGEIRQKEELGTRVTLQNERIISLQNKVSKMNSEKTKLRNRITQLENELHKAKEGKLRVENELSFTKLAKDEIHQKNAALIEKLNNHKQEIESIKSSFLENASSSFTKISAGRLKLSEAEESLFMKTNQIEELQSRNKALFERNEQLHFKLELAEKDLIEYRQQSPQMQILLKSKEEEIRNLESKCSILSASKNQAISDLNLLSIKFRCLEQDTSDEQTISSKLLEHIRALEDENERLKCNCKCKRI